MRKIKPGSIVCIDFLDHSEYSGTDTGPIPATVIGVLISEGADAYDIACWITGRDFSNHNNRNFSILKAVITKVKLLAPSL